MLARVLYHAPTFALLDEGELLGRVGLANRKQHAPTDGKLLNEGTGYARQRATSDIATASPASTDVKKRLRKNHKTSPEKEDGADLPPGRGSGAASAAPAPAAAW